MNRVDRIRDVSEELGGTEANDGEPAWPRGEWDEQKQSPRNQRGPDHRRAN